MDVIDLFQRLSVALAIGLLIGLERGWQSRAEAEGLRAAGFRTHALSGLLGGVWGALAVQRPNDGLLALALAFATYSAAVIVFRLREMAHDGTYGMTTVVAGMLAFALGAFAVLGDMRAAAAAGVVASGLLALKSVLHGWLQRLSARELQSTLVLLAMSVIMLPLLPNRTIDRWGTINPFELWSLTIMIAAISFAGYIAIKVFGTERGALFSGVAGGLASSTAVTLTMSRLAKQHPQQRKSLIAGALVAGATMIARVLVLTGVLNADVFVRLVYPLVAAGSALVAAAYYLLRTEDAQTGVDAPLPLDNPFELSTVLKFGVLLTVVGIIAKLATGVAGSAGAYVVAALSGIADVDALTLSMARLGGQSIPHTPAAIAIAIAVFVNTIAKAVMGWMAGGEPVGRLLAYAAAASTAAGLAGLAIASLL